MCLCCDRHFAVLQLGAFTHTVIDFYGEILSDRPKASIKGLKYLGFHRKLGILWFTYSHFFFLF